MNKYRPISAAKALCSYISETPSRVIYRNQEIKNVPKSQKLRLGNSGGKWKPALFLLDFPEKIEKFKGVP